MESIESGKNEYTVITLSSKKGNKKIIFSSPLYLYLCGYSHPVVKENPKQIENSENVSQNATTSIIAGRINFFRKRT